MIKIERAGEPEGLAERRTKQLATVGATCPERNSSHTNAYLHAKPTLVKMQHHKCCYCDRRHVPDHNSVEHFRPFARYWWLAWTWENLLFACAACNGKGGKSDQFPLASGCAPLSYLEQPPGGERPLLIDPTVDDPRQHIHFAKLPTGRWTPIGKTERGSVTIRALGLARDSYLEEIAHHVDHVVMPVVRDLQTAHAVGFPTPSFADYWHRKCAELLDPARPCLALSEDVLRSIFPSYPDPPGSTPAA